MPIAKPRYCFHYTDDTPMYRDILVIGTDYEITKEYMDELADELEPIGVVHSQAGYTEIICEDEIDKALSHPWSASEIPYLDDNGEPVEPDDI